jgi:hypothetical protein
VRVEIRSAGHKESEGSIFPPSLVQIHELLTLWRCADGGAYNFVGYVAYIDYATGSFVRTAIQNNNATGDAGLITITNGGQSRAEYVNRTGNGGDDIVFLDGASQAFEGDLAQVKLAPEAAPRVQDLLRAGRNDFLFEQRPELESLKMVRLSSECAEFLRRFRLRLFDTDILQGMLYVIPLVIRCGYRSHIGKAGHVSGQVNQYRP